MTTTPKLSPAQREAAMSDQEIQDAQWLGERIVTFLAEHGKRSTDGEWNSPDAYEMENAACLLMNRMLPDRVPFSEWGSGGYQPYASKECRIRHDSLKGEIENLITDAGRALVQGEER